MTLQLVRERELLTIRTLDNELQKKLSIWNGAPSLYVDDLIEFMNSDEKLIRRFLIFVLEERKKEFEERKRKLDQLIEYVEGLINE